MHSTYNGEKSIIAEKFMRILKSKIYKHTTALSKNVDINKLDELIDKYSKTYHGAIKIKPADFKPSI